MNGNDEKGEEEKELFVFATCSAQLGYVDEKGIWPLDRQLGN
jgi:hypothetical protein